MAQQPYTGQDAPGYSPATPRGQMLSRLQSLENDYQVWKGIYKDVRQNIAPFAAWFPDEDSENYNPLGNDNRYNAEVTRAHRVFGAGMMYGNCRPSTPWFQFELDDPDLSKFRPVREWLDACEKIFYNIFAKSNFYEAQQIGFEDQGAFGTTVILPEPRPRYPFVYFHHFPVGTYRLVEGNYGKIDTIYRPIKMQARNIVKAFGKENIGDTLKNAVENSPYGWFDVVHVIEPRDDTEREYGRMDNKNMRWKSCWWDKASNDKNDGLFRESGYPSFPAICPRFITTPGYAYGIGPGIDALKRMKMLQQMELSGIKGMHREVEPPLVAPNRFDGVLDLRPNAINFDGGESGKGQVYPIFNTSINWQWFQSRLDAIEQSIDRAFMLDLFLMIMQSAEDDPQRTATEVLKRWEEKMTVLGPVTEHQQVSNFDPMFEVVWRIVAGIPGILPPPPKEIQGKEIKVHYVSVLARAQRLAMLDDIGQFLRVAENVATFEPGIVNAINGHGILKNTDEAMSLPSNILRSEKEYQQRLKKQQEAQAAAAKLQAMESATASAKNLGQASVEEGTALGAMTQ